ncbi:MAG TPA: hydantoinase/oxoprolinase family protein [Candidatus Binataceae bacterium]|nr:hydantoinase/oxoprolinase family protein [Candidatus Binataceae bacterium]
MSWKVTIDNGSTFTDGCLLAEDDILSVKVLTTPYDLMSCFAEVFKSLARAAGLANEAELLRRVEEVRYSTTAGTNALLVRKGVRVGVIVDSDAITSVYGLRTSDSQLIDTLLGDRVAGFPSGEMSASGIDRNLLDAVRVLLNKGSQWIAISLSGAAGATAERELKRRYMKLLPGHLLGAVPVLFSRELCADPDDARRTATVLLNSFLHKDMARFLYHGDNWLRERHVAQPLRIMRNDEGCGRVAKTIAVKTLDSGPVGGLLGASALAKPSGFNRALTMDVGGTSTDLGVIENMSPVRETFGAVHGLPMSFSMPALTTVALGGGSIFRVSGGKITIGPDSAGALPGPACFGRGGVEPTLTDAALVAGYLDKGRFADGAIALKSDAAEKTILEKIAKPLALKSALEGASAMIESFANSVADAIRATIVKRGWKASEITLVCYGSSGPMLAYLIAEKAELRHLVIPVECASFSALGVAFGDLSHEYRWLSESDNASSWRNELTALAERAARDSFGEGASSWTTSLSVRDRSGSARTFANIEDAGSALGRLNGTAVVDYRIASKGSTREAIPRPRNKGTGSTRSTTRDALVNGGVRAVEIIGADGLAEGENGHGPCLLESRYWSAVLGSGWKWKTTQYGISLSR